MPTSIALPPEHEGLIAEARRSGACQNSNDIIRRALELLRDRDASRREPLLPKRIFIS
jgi:Arc/MetJ-type ribon-helix-helix transcriptional regulator